ncbi:MAG: Mut7-C RNAse domain-containing protein, partial [Acidobacteriota bacterium]|nr:Mut7-C RNAse domain-containing protein [Acidobacteriota bacterium]
MKFAVDCMLGKLAKWLKILGFDVAYFPSIEDSALL